MKDLKHIKTIETIDKVMDLKTQKLATLKELKDAIGFENSKYTIRKGSPNIKGRFHLIDTSKPNQPVLFDEVPTRIKSYLRTRNVDLKLVQGSELIYEGDEIPVPEETIKTIDDLIKLTEQTLKTYSELKKTINYEYCDYRLGKYKEGFSVRYRLTKKDEEDYLVDGSKEKINKYIDRHKIDRDQIFNIELMNEANQYKFE